jgi:antitoxin CptB
MSGNDLDMRRRRALWRATHRGSKEMDVLLGRFAEQAVAGMNAAEIAVFERLIDCPTPLSRLACSKDIPSANTTSTN